MFLLSASGHRQNIFELVLNLVDISGTYFSWSGRGKGGGPRRREGGGGSVFTMKMPEEGGLPVEPHLVGSCPLRQEAIVSQK